MSTAKKLDAKLDGIVREIKEIKKELIRTRMARANASAMAGTAWASLGRKVSARWDAVSAVDEIAAQRENI